MVPHDEPGLSTPDDQSPHILIFRSIGHVGTSLDPSPYTPMRSILEYNILQIGVCQEKGRDERSTDDHLVCGTGSGSGATLVHLRAGPATSSLLPIRLAPGRERHLPGSEAALLDGIDRGQKGIHREEGPNRLLDHQ